MKIAIPATGPNLDSPVDSRFGRCAYFLIVDSDTLAFEALPNPAATAGMGAGIQAAQLVASKGAEAVVADNIGPNAYQALTAGGIQVYSGARGTVRQTVEQYQAGQLTPATSPTGAPQFGLGLGPGGGRGLGRGMGGGRGMGRGQGRGGGRRF